jgi:uncharacterized protein YbcV (DUF1398 family)
MKTANRQQSIESITRIRYFQKEQTMNRFSIAILCSLILAIFALSATPAFAQDASPNDVDAMDQAYLTEYQQRAVEKYAAMQATQTAKNVAAKVTALPDYGGEIFLQEYDQRARALYTALRRSAPPLVQSEPDWFGEIFLAEYEQRAGKRYQQWLAQQNGRITGAAPR